MEKRFISSNAQPHQDAYHTKWQAPSNIAIVKYWGKTSPQLPKNASLSFALSCNSSLGSITRSGFNLRVLNVPNLNP